MEFKIDFIFVVSIIYLVVFGLAVIIEAIKSIREDFLRKKYRSMKLYCNHCKLAFINDKYTVEHYKYCPECGKELQYLDNDKE